MNDDELTRSRLRFLSFPPKTSLPSDSSRLRSRWGLPPLVLTGTSSALALLLTWSRRKIEGKNEDVDVDATDDVAGCTVIMARAGAGEGATTLLRNGLLLLLSKKQNK
jgi:hypothetical protein